MVIYQGRPKRSKGGSRYKPYRSKRQFELGRIPSMTSLGSKRVKRIRVMGSHEKMRLLSIDTANVLDQKTKKITIVKIKTITGNPANMHFVRRNIMTKGAIIETELGKARITSRPGQDGAVNAVLIS